MVNPVLVTITSPSCSGKSYLLNFIRDYAGLPCLTSTTTRPKRLGEVEGIDCYFINDIEFNDLEQRGEFAELVYYNGYKYGVTKQEFRNKLFLGMTFLIVEPSGIDTYSEYVSNIGASHLRCFLECPEEIRISRFINRVTKDINSIVHKTYSDETLENEIHRSVEINLRRFKSMLEHEINWKKQYSWDLILDGLAYPGQNLEVILNKVKSIQSE